MKKYLVYTIILVAALTFSGCSLVGSGSTRDIGGVMRSTDSGITWEIKNKVDEETSISAVDVLTIIIDPVETDTVYLGTKDKGILISEDNAEKWRKFSSPTESNVYGLAINYFNNKTMYASGTASGRGKIFKTENGGETWSEIYTEPADGTYITAISMNPNNPQNIFVGTNRGVILRTSDGGANWDNLHSAGGAISKIIFSEDGKNNIYFLVYQNKILLADENGLNFREMERKSGNTDLPTIYSFDIDKNKNGTMYIGTERGLYRSNNYGESFEELDIIASSREFPIRSVIVSPFNSNEIIYSAAQAIYKSSDGGEEWSTFQMNTSKSISDIEFSTSSPNLIFAGFRSFK